MARNKYDINSVTSFEELYVALGCEMRPNPPPPPLTEERKQQAKEKSASLELDGSQQEYYTILAISGVTEDFALHKRKLEVYDVTYDKTALDSMFYKINLMTSIDSFHNVTHAHCLGKDLDEAHPLQKYTKSICETGKFAFTVREFSDLKALLAAHSDIRGVQHFSSATKDSLNADFAKAVEQERPIRLLNMVNKAGGCTATQTTDAMECVRRSCATPAVLADNRSFYQKHNTVQR